VELAHSYSGIYRRISETKASIHNVEKKTHGEGDGTTSTMRTTMIAATMTVLILRVVTKGRLAAV